MNNLFNKPQNKQTRHSETIKLISKNVPSKNEKFVKLMKKVRAGALQIAKRIPTKIPKKANGQSQPAEKTFTELLNKKEYLNICRYILNLEPSDPDANSLYVTLADNMWHTVIEALSGVESQSSHVQSVADCIKWAKEESSNHELQWSPNTWEKELEEIFKMDITENLSDCLYDPKAGKGVEKYLDELESKTLQKINTNKVLLGDLYLLYGKCYPGSMLEHVTILASNEFTYEERVYLYRWTYKESSRQLKYLLEYSQEACDHLLFHIWFADNGKIITSSGQTIIKKALREILQKEIVFNEYPGDKLEYYFNDIPKDIDKVIKVVEGLCKSILFDVQKVCWDELLHFIQRYSHFVQNKVTRKVPLSEFYVQLRIVKNCQILWKVLKNLGNVPKDKREINNQIMSLIDQSENHGLDILIASLRSEMKEAFKNYFTKSSLEFEKVLEKLQCNIKDAEVQDNEMIMKKIYLGVLRPYIQAFFKYYKKITNSKSEILSSGNRKLQDMFTALVPRNITLDSPIKFILEILESKDTETGSLEVTINTFAHEYPDLGEEHLNVLLDIKGNLNWKQREKLIFYVRNKKVDLQEEKMRFFDETEVQFRGGSKLSICSCCKLC